MRINIRCSYCNSKIINEVNNDKMGTIAIKTLVRDRLILCSKCTSDKDARIWLSDKIINDVLLNKDIR